MKKILSLFLAVLLCAALVSCGGETTPADEPVKTSVTLVAESARKSEHNEATGETTATLTGEKVLLPGATVTATVTGSKYLALEYFGLPRAIVYVPDGTYVFTVPQKADQNDYPPDTFSANYTLTASVPTKEELTSERNISVNPYDTKENTAFPHATTNNEYNNGGDSDFWVRNAIDGCTDNDAHGSYPHQSWGPERVDNVECAIDFGRTVHVTGISIHVRADFPHDIEWESCDVCDENGNYIGTLSFSHTKDAQAFAVEATVSKLVFTNMKSKEPNKAESARKWVGFTEITVTGADLAE